MPVNYVQEVNNTFVKGLVTEAGGLTFPKDASVDELNCDLLKNGSRRRRLGMAFETGGVLSTETISSGVVSTHAWRNVGGEAGVEFLVVQNGDTLLFYKQNGSALSGDRVDTTRTSGVEYSLDLSTYQRPSGLGASTEAISVASINGALVIASAEIDTFYVTRDRTTGAFTEHGIPLLVRDFKWLGDTTTYGSPIATSLMDDLRQYDTFNSGWHSTKGTAAIATYETANTQWPALNLPWFTGKDSSGDFSVTEWERFEGGTSLRVNGHYVTSLYSKFRFGLQLDDHTILGGTAITSALDTDLEIARFSTVAAYSGRMFYSGLTSSDQENGSKVFFSRLLEESLTDLGNCYSVNDPTSEDFSDLLDSDGGSILLPEAYGIKKLHVFAASLYVFAENGVWVISGVDDVFRATEYSVSKIAEVGLSSARSFVSAQGRPYWWSTTGIHTLTANEAGVILEQNLSLNTIQTFWVDIGADNRDQVIATYDGVNKRVMWLYPNDGETVANKKNRMLILDEHLGAFYPWTISDSASNTDYVVGASFYDGAGSTDVEFIVVDGAGNTVIDGSGNTVITTKEGRQYSSSAIKFLVVDGATNTCTFAELTDFTFGDWGDADYSSYAEGGYTFLGDMLIKKTAPYVTVYQEVTETGWQGDEDTGYTPIRESSLNVSHFWDFKSTSGATAQEAYRLKYLPVANPSNLGVFGYPESVVTTRLKLRGRGRSVRIRFESSAGKDFHLMGWDVLGARNPRF